MPKERQLLDGLDRRPWLAEPEADRNALYGNERRDPRGRVRVTLGKKHRYANSGGWCWRYRLLVSYALGRRLRRDEHVDHINGVIDDDRLSNLRILTPEIHGRYHAWLIEIAGCRGPDGRFKEYQPSDVVRERACRLGPVISTREIDAVTWLPLTSRLSRNRHA